MTTFHIARDWCVSDEVEDVYPSRSRFAIPPRDSRTAVTPMRWVTGGEEIEVQGITISRGMVYFGAAGPEEEPSLVNPLLPIAMYRDDSPEPVDFSPTYDRLSPTGRLRYLEWLADGARAPIDIGYVFLYFYGIERRTLLDQAVTPAELQALECTASFVPAELIQTGTARDGRRRRQRRGRSWQLVRVR